jgi:predicted AAA+ superfamily ATPase
MLPYSFSEYLDLVDEPAAQRIVVRDNISDTIRALDPLPLFDERKVAEHRRRFLLIGGFPELLNRHGRTPAIAESEQDGLLQSQLILRTDAVERAIYKDIPQSFGIDNPMLLERLLYVLAGQATGILSPSNICKDLEGLSQPTLDRYLSFLEQAYLVFRLTNYAGNEASIQKRGRKLFFLDGAVRNAALQRGLAPLSNPNELGLLQENMAAAAVHGLGQHTGVRVHYWRDGNKNEVDLIFDHPTDPLAFELASNSNHSAGGLDALQSTHPRFKNRTYLVAPGLPLTHPEQSARGVGQISLDLLLVAVGRQASAALARQLPSGL